MLFKTVSVVINMASEHRSKCEVDEVDVHR